MPSLITPAQWVSYKNIINQAHDTFFMQTIIWRRFKEKLKYHGEETCDEYEDVPLLGLIQYDDFRVWPVTEPTNSGELDKQTEVLILNLKYLRDNGYLNANDNFDYNFSRDRFIHDKIIYKSTGETKTSQAQNEPLLLNIILLREETLTGDDRM